MQDFAKKPSTHKSGGVNLAKHPAKHQEKTPSRWSKFWQAISLIISIFSILFLISENLQFGGLLKQRPNESLLVLYQGVDNSPAYVLTANFSELQLTIFPINPTQEVMVGDYGSYRFQAIYPLLTAIEQKPLNFLRANYSFTIGTILDEVWPVSQPLTQWNKPAAVQKMFFSKEILNLPLTLQNKISWLALLHDVRTEYIFMPILESLPATTALADFNSTSFSCSVALVNTTASNGLASRVEGLLSKAGFAVVRTTNSELEQGQSELVVSSSIDQQGNCQAARNKIEKLLPTTVKYQINDQETVKYRADLVVKLGQDILQ